MKVLSVQVERTDFLEFSEIVSTLNLSFDYFAESTISIYGICLVEFRHAEMILKRRSHHFEFVFAFIVGCLHADVHIDDVDGGDGIESQGHSRDMGGVPRESTSMPLMRLKERTMGRTPYDGKPYYCVECDAGFGEFMACELPDCRLESERGAETRAASVAKPESATE